MARVVISECIITIGVVIASAIAVSAFIANLTGLGAVITLKHSTDKETMLTRIEVVFATNTSSSSVKVWVKNIGIHSISGPLIEKSDLFFGPRGNFTRIPYGGPGPPMWEYTIANDDGDGDWEPGETIEITITVDYTLGPGDYYVKFVTYRGAYDDYSFSI